MDYNTLSTFWDTLEAVGIEIPAIQRDYAQGRETGKVPVIRKRFIQSIIESIENNDKLRLDFVYGKIYGEKNEDEIRKNTKAIYSLLNSVKDYADSIDLIVPTIDIQHKSNNVGETVYLIPLDGQQRLTALFLIHWYLIKRVGLMSELDILRRFRYKTRKSTELFIEMLCTKNFQIDFDKEIREEIVNHEFFSNTWLDDPTVRSMLVVLNEIDTVFKNSISPDFQFYWNNLTKNKVICFDFLNLKNFNLSDDLYVKMNARGKTLSDFENFKAWLFGKIENEEGWYPEDKWKKDESKFDVVWNDIFWQEKDEDVFEVDDAYFNFFKIQYLIDIVKKAEVEKSSFKNGNDEDVIDNIRENVADFDFEQDYDHRFKERLCDYFKLLNISSKQELSAMKHDHPSVESYYKFFFNNTKKIEWVDLIENYIVSAYFEVNIETDFDRGHFDKYIRVLSNLVNNQTFDSARLYQSALKDIYKINKYLYKNECDIYAWLEALELENNTWVFTEDQLKEEIKKYKLIIGDTLLTDDPSSWLNLLTNAENNDYFRGKVEFLLTISNSDKALFVKNFTKLSSIFQETIVAHPEYLFHRALLTLGNYFLEKGVSKVSFVRNLNGSYRDRRENWLGVLTNSNKITIVKKLIDSPLFDETHVEESLRVIIEDWIKHNPIDVIVQKDLSELEYRQLYIHCFILFNYGESNLIQLSSNEKYAFQLNKSNTGGYFKDIIIEFIKNVFYLESENVKAFAAMGWGNSPILQLSEEFTIKLDPSKNYYILETESETLELKTIKELLEVIDQENSKHD